MKFTTRQLMITVAVVAVLFVVAVPYVRWAYSPSMFGLMVTASAQEETTICARTFYTFHPTNFANKRSRILTLHRLNRQPGDIPPKPPWLEYKFKPGHNDVTCTIDGRHAFATDAVQIFFSTDNQPPRRVFVAYDDFRRFERAIPHELWNAFVDKAEP